MDVCVFGRSLSLWCELSIKVHIINPLSTVFCVVQLKYRGGPVLVSEKKGCQLCHNTFSEPDCACLPGGTPVHINCVAKKALDLPHENAHHSNHTWSWTALWGSRWMLALHPYGTQRIGHLFRAQTRASGATRTCFPCAWRSHSTNECLGEWDAIYSIIFLCTQNTDNGYEILMKRNPENLTLSLGWSY